MSFTPHGGNMNAYSVNGMPVHMSAQYQSPPEDDIEALRRQVEAGRQAHEMLTRMQQQRYIGPPSRDVTILPTTATIEEVVHPANYHPHSAIHHSQHQFSNETIQFPQQQQQPIHSASHMHVGFRQADLLNGHYYPNANSYGQGNLHSQELQPVKRKHFNAMQSTIDERRFHQQQLEVQHYTPPIHEPIIISTAASGLQGANIGSNSASTSSLVALGDTNSRSSNPIPSTLYTFKNTFNNHALASNIGASSSSLSITDAIDNASAANGKNERPRQMAVQNTQTAPPRPVPPPKAFPNTFASSRLEPVRTAAPVNANAFTSFRAFASSNTSNQSTKSAEIPRVGLGMSPEQYRTTLHTWNAQNNGIAPSVSAAKPQPTQPVQSAPPAQDALLPKMGRPRKRPVPTEPLPERFKGRPRKDQQAPPINFENRLPKDANRKHLARDILRSLGFHSWIEEYTKAPATSDSVEATLAPVTQPAAAQILATTISTQQKRDRSTDAILDQPPSKRFALQDGGGRSGLALSEAPVLSQQSVAGSSNVLLLSEALAVSQQPAVGSYNALALSEVPDLRPFEVPAIPSRNLSLSAVAGLSKEIPDLRVPVFASNRAPIPRVAQKVAGSSKQAPEIAATPVKRAKTPLFLPSPESSAAEVIEIGDSEEEPKIKGPKRPRMQAYVLVPPAPAWVSKYKTWERKRAKKSKPRHVVPSSDDDEVEFVEAEPVATNSSNQIRKGKGQEKATVLNDPYSDLDLESRTILDQSGAILGEYECHWDSCDCILNCSANLTRHVVEEHVLKGQIGKKYICLWKACDQSFFNRQTFHDHVVSHTRLPLVCPYEGCEEMSPTVPDIVSHIQKEHGEADTLKPTSKPFAYVNRELPPTPTTLPAYMMYPRPVTGALMSNTYHLKLREWVFRQVHAPIDVLPTSKRKSGYRKPHDEYSFLETNDPVRPKFSRLLSAGFFDIRSPAVSQYIHDGLVIWSEYSREPFEWDMVTESAESEESEEEEIATEVSNHSEVEEDHLAGQPGEQIPDVLLEQPNGEQDSEEEQELVVEQPPVVAALVVVQSQTQPEEVDYSVTSSTVAAEVERPHAKDQEQDVVAG